MVGILRDLRFAIRLLFHSPTFTAVSVLTLPGRNSESSASAGPSDTLHATTTPNTGEGSHAECESGNEAYAPGKQVIGHAPGQQAALTEVTK